MRQAGRKAWSGSAGQRLAPARRHCCAERLLQQSGHCCAECLLRQFNQSCTTERLQHCKGALGRPPTQQREPPSPRQPSPGRTSGAGAAAAACPAAVLLSARRSWCSRVLPLGTRLQGHRKAGALTLRTLSAGARWIALFRTCRPCAPPSLSPTMGSGIPCYRSHGWQANRGCHRPTGHVSKHNKG